MSAIDRWRMKTKWRRIEPVVALVAGILILIMPELLNIIVAVYLIVVGALGLAQRA